MAFVTQFLCHVCKESCTEVIRPDHICSVCRKQASTRARRLHFAALEGLTLQERVEMIERQLYDLNLVERLGALEAANARY